MTALCRRLTAALLTLALAACASVESVRDLRKSPPPSPEAESVPEDSQRAAVALATLPDLRETDVLIRLDNELLRRQMIMELEERAGFIGSPSIRDIDIRFGRQFIGLAARLDLTGPQGELLTVDLSGDVRLAFSGDHLIWLPQFLEARIQRNQPDPARTDSPRLTLAELAANVERINREITDAVIILGKHTVQLRPVPMGRMEVGVDIDGLPRARVEGGYDLGGVFTVAGSSILIEPASTSVALDLEFVPNITACTPDLAISRSGFAQEIQDREPVGVSRYLEAGAEIRHFFTEVRGATHPTAVLHYWFADGQPAGLEELAVEPSERWRTWSTKAVNQTNVRNWEVVVVERDTGCILHSQAIRSEPVLDEVDILDQDREPYRAFSDAFRSRLAGFSILDTQPDVAQIEIDRQFMGRVLQSSLQDIKIDAAIEMQGGARSYQAALQPFAPDRMACEAKDCQSARVCSVGVSRCIRKHDTRDCTTCLFRNPLNNRCVNQVEDPICVAARDAQNELFEAARDACLLDERTAQQDCERLRAQEIRSCTIEGALATDMCTSTFEALQKLQNSGRMALVAGEASPAGSLSARFSGFELSGDLSTLDMNMELRSDAYIRGTLQVRPSAQSGSVGQCLAAWQAPFQGQLLMPAETFTLLGAVVEDESALVTNWSGFMISARTNPAPLEAIFVEHPAMLADCQMGLRLEDVTRALEGDAAGFYRGVVQVEVRPLPSKILLAPAVVKFGSRLYSAEPTWQPGHLKFEIGRGTGDP